MNNMTITQLRAKARKKRVIDCPPYSKMTKEQLIRYLSGNNKNKSRDDGIVDSIELTKQKFSKNRSRTLSLPKSSKSQEPLTKHQELLMRQEKYSRPDSPNAPRFIRRTTANPSKRNRNKSNRKKTIRLKIKSRNQNDLSTMKVVELKQLLKQNKLKISGKKSELIQRLEEFPFREQKEALIKGKLIQRLDDFQFK